MKKAISQQVLENKEIAHLHYISQGIDQKAHLENIERVLQAGCSWVQLRMKDTRYEDLLATAHQAKILCNSYHATLIINDNVSVVQEVDASGVHLGQEDMSTAQAREILGSNKIIGGTANTFEQGLNHIKNGVDYLGMGPLRFTLTKKKLSPILGFEGYTDLIQKFSKLKMNTPIIAIGGVTEADFQPLQETGLYGVAVSGLLTQSLEQKKIIEKVNTLWSN
ncbi:thiamine phosphate synthase [Leeuwenhoekiella marinoflava]|uniref:Thiamine-phosphate synthase n=2 Tax=Leeuwenhoekiella marinoflava TaxID=988 RepID=A0A4Q0PLC3_9FLAO|nr:thiamine phosphate synthase [Leeuwenhoekiella marinoflava]RXG29301.1 thiamine-phosphate diphosphorylase [Leeuwenhoekiella marinoflava]SHG03441.1 thiamine-phosphate diphosphorylase [Leeuwenhoekiella marinoflava DSM 3653]